MSTIVVHYDIHRDDLREEVKKYLESQGFEMKTRSVYHLSRSFNYENQDKFLRILLVNFAQLRKDYPDKRIPGEIDIPDKCYVLYPVPGHQHAPEIMVGELFKG